MYNSFNNFHIRKIIFSYLRKNPKKICFKCQDICIWNKEIKKYFNVYNDKTYCYECYHILLPKLDCIIS